MDYNISWKLLQFPKTEEGHIVLGRCPRKFIIILHNINALFKIIIVHNVEVGLSTK